MRFAIPRPSGTVLPLSRRLSDWPLSLRFVLLTLPVGLLFALVATWTGYRATSQGLHESLESNTLLIAKAQADHLTKALESLQRSVSLVAQSRALDARTLRDNAQLYFQNNLDLLQEVGWQQADGGQVFFLRDAQGILRETELANSDHNPYGPWQQLASSPPRPGTSTFYPAVFVPLAGAGEHSRLPRVPVMRMAFHLDNGRGILLLGINLDAVRHRLAEYIRPDSPLRPGTLDGAGQLSFFFDSDGWILFEADGSGSRSFLANLVRQGYGGDLGRPGFDAAFRPWTEHEDFWNMSVDVREGRSGSNPLGAAKYAWAQSGLTGYLCYAPVFFSPAPGSTPVPVGGVAYFETSSLPGNTFLRLANASLIMFTAAFAVFGLGVLLLGRRLTLPLGQLAVSVKRMNDTGEFHTIECAPRSEEQQKLQAAVNTLASRALAVKTELDRARREISHARVHAPVDLQQILNKPFPDGEFGIVGSSLLVREVCEHIRKAARAGTDVLIWGETGTGKELVAEAIHKAGARNKGPYLSINCGALDENLLLDALFGHVKGAFSEAKTDRKGAFLAAEGGTLHLDEIANASLKVQQALLRALSVRRIRPLGADREIPFNTRVVAATNVDLKACVKAGSFREDLYYRLAIINIETPPLRHHKEDIPELAAYFIREASRNMGRTEPRMSRGALEHMLRYDWPGNVRELRNSLTRALAFAEDDLILPEHINLEQPSIFTEPDGARADQEPEEPGKAAESAPVRSFAARGAGSRGRAAAEAPRRREADASGHAAEYLWPPPPRSVFTPAPEEARRREVLARLNTRQQLVLDYVNRQGQISRSEYQEAIARDVSPRTAQNDLRELVERNLLRRVGAGPGTRYTRPGRVE